MQYLLINLCNRYWCWVLISIKNHLISSIRINELTVRRRTSIKPNKIRNESISMRYIEIRLCDKVAQVIQLIFYMVSFDSLFICICPRTFPSACMENVQVVERDATIIWIVVSPKRRPIDRWISRSNGEKRAATHHMKTRTIAICLTVNHIGNFFMCLEYGTAKAFSVTWFPQTLSRSLYLCLSLFSFCFSLHQVEIALIHCANQNIDFSLFSLWWGTHKTNQSRMREKENEWREEKKQYLKQGRNVWRIVIPQKSF